MPVSVRRTSLVLACVLPLAAATSAFASVDARCDKFLAALRGGDYTTAERLVDPAVRSIMTADALRQALAPVLAQRGNIVRWELSQHSNTGNFEIVVARVEFEHGDPLGFQLAVTAPDEGISGMYFVEPPAASAASTPEASSSAPVENSGNAKFRTERVEVGTVPYLCDGVITIPPGNGPFPAAILVSGSGPNDMDETIGPNHVFKDIAEGLSLRGIEVLRYDKVTHAHKDLDLKTFTVQQEYIDDAVSAVNLLRARAEVDHSRIFVIGHSAGAQLAPDIAKQAEPIAGVVMLAPSARPLLDVLIQQATYLGAPPDKVEYLKKIKSEIADGTLKPDQTIPGLGGATVHYLTDLDNRNEPAVASHLGVPILILHGQRDYQVTNDDIAIWRADLARTPRVTIRELPGLNHLFIAGAGKPNPEEYMNPGHVDAEVITAIANFIVHPESSQ